MSQMKNEFETRAEMDKLAAGEYTDDRQAFVNKLREVWDSHPEYRFGQLLQHILEEIKGNLFFVPDGVFFSELEHFAETGFAGVDRKIKHTDPNANDTISVRAQLEKEGKL